MGVSLAIGESESHHLASTAGWGDVSRWVEGLETDSPELRHLVEKGWADDPAQLESEIQAGMQADPPEDDVVTTLQGLLDLLAARGEETFIQIHGGMGSEDEGEGEGEESAEGAEDEGGQGDEEKPKPEKS
jgi:hypothetical protein